MGLGPSQEKLRGSQDIHTVYTVPEDYKDEDNDTVMRDDKNGTLKVVPIQSHLPSLEKPMILTTPPVPHKSTTETSTGQHIPHYWDDGVPTVFSWNKGGKAVYLAGTFNNWKEKIEMRQSRADFVSIQNLPPGVYLYRFIVDGKWEVDPSQPQLIDSNGEPNNYVQVRPPDEDDSLSLNKPSSAPSSPPGMYGQLLYNEQTFRDSPPGLPPHLLRALLNTAPPHADPQLLPLPHHVMLNHLYRIPRIEDKMLIVGVTTRYKSKYVTTVFYEPLENDNAMEPRSPFTPLTPSPCASLASMKIDSSDQLQQMNSS